MGLDIRGGSAVARVSFMVLQKIALCRVAIEDWCPSACTVMLTGLLLLPLQLRCTASASVSASSTSKDTRACTEMLEGAEQGLWTQDPYLQVVPETEGTCLLCWAKCGERQARRPAIA